MNPQQAVDIINNFNSARLYAEFDETDTHISGGINPTLVDWLEGLQPFYSVEETFALKPSKNDLNLWFGNAHRHGHACHFPPKPLEELVMDICDFYVAAEELDSQPEIAQEFTTILSEKGFYCTREGAGGITILGSMQENFTSPDFSIVRFGKFFVGIDIKNGPKNFINSPVIICSRSIEAVVEALAAYFDKKTE
jgi:hypothetical protein